MTTISKLSPLERIAAMEQASQARAAAAANNTGMPSKHFVGNSIVVLKDGERALFRPIYNMDQSIARLMHDKYKNTNTRLGSYTKGGVTYPAPISAICATENGHACMFCAEPASEKLEPRDEIFLPGYLWGIKKKDNSDVTYTDGDGNTKVVRGFRMLRLKQGSSILKQLMDCFKDPDYYNDVTLGDFIIEREGAEKKTKYSCSPKPQKPMEANLKAAIPPLSVFEAILEEVYPELVYSKPEVINEIMGELDPLAALQSVRMETASDGSNPVQPLGGIQEFTF